jgi:hypothetical protein
MIEEILDGKSLLAIILRKDLYLEGIKFFTPKDFSQQLGYMNRPKDYIIQPHLHNNVIRDVFQTQEVLFIKSGKVQFDVYSNHQKHIGTFILFTGDVVLLASGGHGFKMLEDTQIIEVKTGPHIGDADKTRFAPESE